MRDAIVDADAVRWRYSPAEMAVWREWFEDTLLNGQRWFTATLPGRGGWLPRVARYIGEQLQLTHLGAGFWEVSCRLELRGLSAAPLLPPYFVRSSVSASTDETVHRFEMPLGAVAGDVLVVVYAIDKQLATVVTLDTETSGSGWTDTILEAVGARGFAGVAWKVAEGGDVLQFTTNVGEQSQAFAVCVKTDTGDVTVAASDNGATSAPNPPLCTPAFGASEYLWIAAAASVVLDATPANTSAFSGFPAGYDDSYALTGQPNNPSLAIALKLATAASENPGAFATTRTEAALTHTVGVRL